MNSIQKHDPTLRDLLKVLSRRRSVTYWVTAVVFLIAVLICVFSTRRYEASGVIQLQKSTADALNLESMMGGGGGGGGTSDGLMVNVDLQTQSRILQSESLALKVIKDLNLENNNKDFQSKFSILGALDDLFSAKSNEQSTGDLEQSPRRRNRLLRVFKKNLSVKVVAGTRLIEVRYSNVDQKVAAEVVNRLVQALIDYTFQTKFAATSDVSGWLEGQLSDLRKQNEGLQTKVVALQKETGLFGISGSDVQGRPIIFSPILGRLQQSTTELSEAKMNRILKGSVYEIVRSGNAELISQLSGNTFANGASPGVANGLNVIQSLRTREAALQEQIAQDAAKFGPAYPKLAEEHASLKQVQQSLADEISRTASRAKNDYEIARKTEAGVQTVFNADRSEAEKMNDKTIEYAILDREATQGQSLYQDLLRRLKEAGIIEGLRASNVTIVDPGRAPARPSQPNVGLTLSLGLGIGIFLACCGALLVDAIDNVIRGPEEIEAMQLPLLGILPRFQRVPGSARLLPTAAESAYNEALRSLRSTLLISRSSSPPKVILIASGNPQEGKSTIALGLATALANFNSKVLLVEADLRRPVLRANLNFNGNPGLSVLLANTNARFEPVAAEWQPNLDMLPAGPVPPYPAELLGSKRLEALLGQWRAQYDFIVIDSPPVQPVVEPQILCGMVDATVLIARVDVTTRVALERSYNMLLPFAKNSQSPGVVGIVLNAISPKSPSYYGYYGHGYYGSKYNGYYGEKHEDA